MTPFFRKLRKQLSDDNKPAKYIRYAAGEIILVVIGILIALSINNWNENRKVKIKEGVYLANIKTDLEMNIISLREFINTRNESIISANNILDYFNKKKELDLDEFNFHTINVMIWFPFIQNDNSFLELMNSGNLALISNKSIKNELLNMQAKYKNIEFIENEMQQDFENYLYDPYFTIVNLDRSLKNYNEQIEQAKVSTQITEIEVSELLKNNRFVNGFVLSIYNSQLLLDEYNSMIDRTNQTIELIDLELNVSD